MENSHLMQPIGSEDILYHYTNEAGLHGIFRSKEIWATSITHETDKAEFTYALGLAHDVIAERFTLAASETERVFLEKIQNELPRDAATALQHYYIFVASFCQQGNLQYQWNNYGRFCIGFHRPQLTEPDRGFSLKRCVYSTDEQKNIIRGYLEDALVNSNPAPVQTLYLYAMRFKNPFYSDEKEWRLVSYHPIMKADKRPDLRDPRIEDNPKPHFKYPLTIENDKLRICKLAVGPGVDQQRLMDVAHLTVKEFSDRVAVQEIIAMA